MHRSRWFALSAFAVCLAVPAVSAAQYEDSYIGPSVGIFMPIDGDLRDALGSQWLSFGLSNVKTGQARNRMMGFNYNVTSNSRDGNKAFLLTGSYGLVQPLGDAYSSTRPYFAIRGGLTYMDYSLDVDNDRVSAKRIGINANAELGVVISERLTLSARYDIFSAADGLSFNGLSLNLKYGLARF